MMMNDDDDDEEVVYILYLTVFQNEIAKYKRRSRNNEGRQPILINKTGRKISKGKAQAQAQAQRERAMDFAVRISLLR